MWSMAFMSRNFYVLYGIKIHVSFESFYNIQTLWQRVPFRCTIAFPFENDGKTAVRTWCICSSKMLRYVKKLIFTCTMTMEQEAFYEYPAYVIIFPPSHYHFASIQECSLCEKLCFGKRYLGIRLSTWHEKKTEERLFKRTSSVD